MGPLLEQTVASVLEKARSQEHTLKNRLIENRKNFEIRVKELTDTLEYDDIIKVVKEYESTTSTLKIMISQFEDDIDYLNNCNQNDSVKLSKQEWFHYFQGRYSNREWC